MLFSGTAPNRKGFPREVINAKLKVRSDKIVVSNGPLMTMKIKDKKCQDAVNNSKSSEVSTGKRDHNDRMIKRCEVVHLYNQFMGAVDRSDQMVAYSSFRRRTIKWWKKVFFHMLSLTILNSWIVYSEWCRSNGRTPVLQRVFRRVGQTIGEGGGGHTNGKVKVTHSDLNQSSKEVKWPSFSLVSAPFGKCSVFRW